MRTFKFLLTSLVLLLVVMVSCSKSELEKQTEAPAPEMTFVKKNSADTKEAMKILEQFEAEQAARGGDMSYLPLEKGSTDCCRVSDLSLRVGSGTHRELHLEFTLGSDDSAVRVWHYLKKPSGGWQYLGYDNLVNGLPHCLGLGVNRGTGNIPSGEIFSYAQVWRNSENAVCGPSKFLYWTRP